MPSVGARLFLAVLLVLLLSFGVLGFLNVRLHRQHLEAEQRTAALRLADVVRRSTSHYMLRNDREALRHIIDTIGRQPGITRLRIVDANGRVAFAYPSSAPSLRSGPPSPRTRGEGLSPHVSPVPLSPLAGRGWREAPGEGRILRTVTPIQNSQSCATAACHAHPPTQKTLGVLELNLSLADADRSIRAASWQFAAQSTAAIILTLITTAIFVWWTRTLEDRVHRKTLELRRAQEQMIQAEKLTSLGKLAAVVAHEINNPLSGILTYAKLLRKWIERGDKLEPHAGEMRESLQLIENESRRCGEIVRSLLTFARAQPMNISDFDLNAIVRICIKLVEHKLELGNINAELDLAPGLPPVRGDAGQIEQLLLALVMNAIEAMPREGNLRIATSAGDDSIVIRVEDDGVGIPPDILPRLFEPFTTTKEEGKGVGLGLAISRAIVERHAGRISVQSAPGRGTAFTITLPCNMHMKEVA